MKKLAMMSALAGAMLFSGAARADLVVYTDLAAWQAAAGAHTVETFSSATPNFSAADFAATGFNGFTLSSVSNGDHSGIADGPLSSGDPVPAPFNGQNFYGWGDSGNGNEGPTSTFTFAAGTTAFGFDWFNTDSTDRYSLTINGSVFIPFDYVSSGFFGIVATNGESFSSAVVQTADYGGYISTEGLDNVRVGAAAAAVPEPGSLALLGLGLAGLAFGRKRRAA